MAFINVFNAIRKQFIKDRLLTDVNPEALVRKKVNEASLRLLPNYFDITPKKKLKGNTKYSLYTLQRKIL